MDDRLKVSFECRDIRHAWQRDRDVVLLADTTSKISHFERVLVCERCGTERVDEFRMTSLALVRERTRYRYVKDYQVSEGRYPLEAARIQRFTELLQSYKGESVQR